MSAINDVLGVMDGEWRTARQIHERIGMWSHRTVRHCLAAIVKHGDAEARSDPTLTGTISSFRRMGSGAD